MSSIMPECIFGQLPQQAHFALFFWKDAFEDVYVVDMAVK
jgi:hypothetical protein